MPDPSLDRAPRSFFFRQLPGEWQEAVARFRAMLARNPDLPRVRLDLAFVYFQAEDDGNAACHFRLVLGAKDLPETVRASARAFLDRIRRRKRWSVTGSVAVVPDTNINARTDAREILLFGQRTTLSEDTRRASGVGVTVNMSGGYEGRVLPDLRFRVGGGLQTRTCRESDFNDQIVNLYAGPRFLFDKFDLRPAVTARQRWLGGTACSRALGIGLSGGAGHGRGSVAGRGHSCFRQGRCRWNAGSGLGGVSDMQFVEECG